MSANQAMFPIATMARVLGVSEAGYYAWRHRLPSAHALVDAALLKQVRTIHASSRETYGAPRVHAALRADGGRHGRKRVARLMRAAGLVGASRRRAGVATTKRDKEARPAPGLHSDRAEPALGRRYYVRAHSSRVPVSRRGLGRLEPQDRRLVHGEPSTGRVGGRCAGDGVGPASAAQRDRS